MGSNRCQLLRQRRGASTRQTIGTAVAAAMILVVAYVGFVMWAQSARENARQYTCIFKLKDIGLAMHNHHDVYGSFPPTFTVNEQSERLQSWRTITSQFFSILGGPNGSNVRFDEPWDSSHNMNATQLMPELFHCAARSETSPQTIYFVVDAPHGLFDGSNLIRFDDITDGTAVTIAALENSEMVERWNAPIDLTLNTATPLHSEHPNGVNVVIADGSVHRFREDMSPEVFQSLVLIDDGGPKDFDQYTISH